MVQARRSRVPDDWRRGPCLGRVVWQHAALRGTHRCRLYVESDIMTNAQANNAVAIQLEHRYYGETHPLPDVTLDSLAYLTSEQVRAEDLHAAVTPHRRCQTWRCLSRHT